MDIVLIKLFKKDIECADYHDIMLDDYRKKVEELHKYGEKINKKVLFTVSNASSGLGDCFAEITTNCILTKQEKEYFVQTLKFFCSDAKISNGAMEIKQNPLTALFCQKQFEDIVEL